jgi:STE24 endopeptidase
MLPLPLLLALVLAFGLDDLSGAGPVPAGEVAGRLGLFAALIALPCCLAMILGASLALGRPTVGQSVRRRRRLGRVASGLDWLAVAAFGVGLFALEWPRLIAWNFGLRRAVLADEALVLLPYLVAQIVIWISLYPAERRLRGEPHPAGVGRHVLSRLRQTAGLLLPMLLLYGLGRDLLRWAAPSAAGAPLVQLAGLAVMSSVVLLLSPAFVRLSWPMHRLEPGPLRDRLERLARRLGFRFSDILVWETGGTLVNAGITGPLPFFRYVLLSDALVERLDPREIEAVFGHEVGHIMHRHLTFFGFFLLGSLGLLSMLETLVRNGLGAAGLALAPWASHPRVAELVSLAAAGLVLAVYFFAVFGFLSRRFEWEADVFACRVVSCARAECPPHRDPNAAELAEPVPPHLCPVGARIFASALGTVAMLNGLEPRAPSWRHGSIARRIAFVEGLADQPEALGRFRGGLRRLRVTLALALVLGTLAAIWVLSRTGGL